MEQGWLWLLPRCPPLFCTGIGCRAAGAVTIEGRIMDWDLKKNMIVVNEKSFFWNSKTLFYDEKGNATKRDQLRQSN